MFSAGEHNGAIRMQTLDGHHCLRDGCRFHNFSAPQCGGGAAGRP